MAETVNKIRAISYENDYETGCRSVVDIREFEAVAASERTTSFTAISKDKQRRQLMMELLREADRLLSGEVDEVVLILTK